MSDLPKGPKTVEEARALREVSPTEGIPNKSKNGVLIRTPLSPHPIEGDSILLFVDSDGVSKEVTTDGDEWVKQLVGAL